jgi:RNA polymerase sigma factor (sigma-70 family)
MRVAWRNEAPGAELGMPGSGGRRAASRSGAAQAEAAAPPETAAYPDWDAIYTDNVGRIYRLLFAKVGNRPDAEDLTSQVFLAALGPLRTTASVGEVRAYLLAAARTVLAAHWRRTLGHQVTVIDPAGMDLAEFAGTADGSRPGAVRERRPDPPDSDLPYPGAPHPGSSGPGYSGPPGSGYSSQGYSGSPGPHYPGPALTDQERSELPPDDPRVRADRILAALPERHRRILALRFLQGCSVKEAAAELGVTVANAKVLQHRALRRAAGLDREPDQKGDA